MYNMVIYKSIDGDDYDDMKHGLDSLINAKNALVAIQDTMRCHDICRQYIQTAIDSFIEHDKRREQPVFVYPKAISMMCEDIDKFKKNELQEVNIDLLNASIENYMKANNILKERIIELETENEKLQGKNATLIANNIKLQDKVKKLDKLQAETVKGLEELHSMLK